MAELLPEDALLTSPDGEAMDELERNIDLAQRTAAGDVRQALHARALIDACLPRRSA